MFKNFFRWFRAPIDPAGNLYYVRLKTSNSTFYKIGFTSKPTLIERMAYGNHGDEKLIEKELLFCFRCDAYLVEQRLLHHFRKHRAFKKYSNDPKMPLPGRGQSELFNDDVLGLDDDLYKILPTELSAEAKEALDEQGAGCFFIFVGLVLAPFTLGISLLFIFMGGSALFGPAAKTGTLRSSTLKAGTRPVHSPALQQLIDDLKRDCALRKSMSPSSDVAGCSLFTPS